MVESPPTQHAHRVLVVEDEDIVRRVIARKLGRLGYDIQEAVHGREALEILAAMPSAPHLIISDIVMPDMGGHAFVEQARARYPGVKTLFISGYPEDELQRRGLLRPGDFFLDKSAIHSDLVAKVESLLDVSA